MDCHDLSHEFSILSIVQSNKKDKYISRNRDHKNVRYLLAIRLAIQIQYE